MDPRRPTKCYVDVMMMKASFGWWIQETVRPTGQRDDLNDSETTRGGTESTAERTQATSANGTRDRVAADVVREAKSSSHCTWTEIRT